MKIGFDSKRAFFNKSGLGNYSRSTINQLMRFYSMHDYFLYTTGLNKNKIFTPAENAKIIEPTSLINSYFKSYWRSFRLSKDIKKEKLDIYHGLSNELPQNVHKTGAKTFVTIHDLIFMRYPELYNSIDRKIYTQKFKYSCEIAHKVIAISEQTKTDIITYFGTDEKKIEVVYQGCNPMYYTEAETHKKIEIHQKYNLPEQYILNVGTIERRKNILTVIKALHQGKIDIPLVIIGGKTSYTDEVEKYITENKLESKVLIFSNVPQEDLPALYQCAELFIYPSLFEGFGIPILEALNSKIPVITTKGGCFSEVGGFNSLYVNPESIEEIQASINKILNDSEYKQKMIAEGALFSQNFRDDKIAENLMNAYLK